MNIEHMTDRNSTFTPAIGVTDMIDVQQALVADHIAGLEREGGAIRAERDRDHLREHALAGTTATDHRADDLPSRRVRLGRWLVALGEAISGSSRSGSTRGLAAMATTPDGPCDDGNDRLATAA
jgi:hypothetical protein